MSNLKLTSLIVLFSSIFLLAGCTTPPISKNNLETQPVGCSVNQLKGETCSQDGVHTGTASSQTGENIVLGSLSKREQLNGKPTFLRRAGKFCAYCRDKIPEVENLIQKEFGNKINLQIMTMNFDTSKFSTTIPQSPYDTFNYQDFTSESCDTFPTWVILDKDGIVISKECGGKTTIQNVVQQLKELTE